MTPERRSSADRVKNAMSRRVMIKNANTVNRSSELFIRDGAGLGLTLYLRTKYATVPRS